LESLFCRGTVERIRDLTYGLRNFDGVRRIKTMLIRVGEAARRTPQRSELPPDSSGPPTGAMSGVYAPTETSNFPRPIAISNYRMMSERTMARDDNRDYRVLDSNRNRRKVLKALGGGAAIGTTGLAGCFGFGGSNGGNGGDATPGGDVDSSEWPDLSGQSVHMLINETAQPFRDLFNQMGADFTAATGAQVNNEFTGIGTGMRQRISQLLQAGEPPEIVFARGANATNLLQAGALHPVDEALEHWEEKWGQPEERSFIQFDGQNWLLPISTKGGVFWYRDDIYSGEPETWDDWMEMSRQADEQEGMRGTFLPRFEGQCPEWYYIGYAWSNGGRWMERDGDGNIRVAVDRGSSRDSWIEMLEFLNELKAYSPSGSEPPCLEAIPSGEAASTIGTVVRPKNQAVERGVPFAREVTGTPPPYKSDEIHTGNAEGFVLLDTPNSEAGMEWLKFLSQIEYNIPLYSITPLQIQPVYEGIRETQEWEDFLSNIPDEWKDQDIEASQYREFEQLPNETDPPNPYVGGLFQSWEVSQMVFDVTVQDMNPAEAVDQHADNLRDVLDRLKQETEDSEASIAYPELL
jgi:ABC-type glycerol-3-phosphate transport system substrate-binding protein